MRKKRKMVRIAPLLIFTAALGMTGCSSTELGDEEEEAIIEYAVNAVINHDKNYIIKLADRPTEEESTTVWITGNPDGETNNKGEAGDGDGSGEEQTTRPQNATVSANEAFNLKGFTVKADGYETVDKYPDNNEGFSMVAIQKSDLLVLKFKITNDSQSRKNLNMLDMDYGYRCAVNEKVRVNAQVTALLNGLNTWNGTFEAGETKEMVLIFQISEEVSANINKISLYITKDSGSSAIAIK